MGSEMCIRDSSGMGYKNDHVNWLAVYDENNADATEPTVDNVKAGKYPIARPLYLYTVGEPEGAVATYINWIKSMAGQEILVTEKFCSDCRRPDDKVIFSTCQSLVAR